MPIDGTPKVVMGLYYFPRGGSAQVARYLCRALGGTPWAPLLFSGSMGIPTDMSNARRFFSGVRCELLDYSAAQADWCRGGDPMASVVPMSASYEAKSGVPDRIFLALDDAAFDRQVTSWSRFFAAHGSFRPSVLHLHHLTPMHEAARAVWPDVPVMTHLHGTELKMLAAVSGGPIPSQQCRWTTEWVERMRGWAGRSERVVVISAQDEQLVRQLLPVDPARITTIANGVDTDMFSRRRQTSMGRLARWKDWLVGDPRGWRPGCPEGSIRYQLDDLAAFTGRDGQPVPVVLFAGRFMAMKRLQLLIEAHHTMRSTMAWRSVLVVVGGFPGEWEGEHPYDTVQRLGAEGVFFAGWRDHAELSEMLNCSDVFAAPAVEEPFGLVYLEAMITGVPPIATNTGGPPTFINVDPAQPTGWLVPPDDVGALTRALAEAVSKRSERIDRGTRAAAFVAGQYSWASSAAAFARLYGELIDEHRTSARLPSDRPTTGVA